MTSDVITGITLKRIVVALDASPHSLAALEASARLAAVFGSELVGIFVEDANLLRAASSPFAREVGRLRATAGDLSDSAIRTHFRIVARQAERHLDETAARFGLQSRMQIVRGHVLDELVVASSECDLIALGQSRGPDSSRRKIGSVARALVDRTRTPVLLMRYGVRLDLAVMVAFDPRSDDADRAVQLAGRLAAEDTRSPLVVLIPAGNRFAEWADHVAGLTSAENLSCIPAGYAVPEEVAHIAGSQGVGLVVLPADIAAARPPLLDRLIGIAGLPIMIVRRRTEP